MGFALARPSVLVASALTHHVLQNLENALPAQQFAGPHGSGGYCAQPLCPHA